MAGDLSISTLGGGPISDRNALINSGFQVNQRAVTGTVTLAAGAYGHDRWKAGAGGCTYTFATSNNVTTLTITAGTLVQVIEGINLQSGGYVLSWTGTAQGRVDAGAYGASGAVIGTAVGGTNQQVEFSAGTLSKVMYEPGNTPTAWYQRQVGYERKLCLDYCRPFNYGHDFNAGSAGQIDRITYSFDPMRATPTVGTLTNSNSTNSTSITVTAINENAVRLVVTGTAAGNVGATGSCLLTAEL